VVNSNNFYVRELVLIRFGTFIFAQSYSVNAQGPGDFSLFVMETGTLIATILGILLLIIFNLDYSGSPKIVFGSAYKFSRVDNDEPFDSTKEGKVFRHLHSRGETSEKARSYCRIQQE
jgi:hypothetical protein